MLVILYLCVLLCSYENKGGKVKERVIEFEMMSRDNKSNTNDVVVETGEGTSKEVTSFMTVPSSSETVSRDAVSQIKEDFSSPSTNDGTPLLTSKESSNSNDLDRIEKVGK